MELDPTAILILIGTLFGGAGLKIIEKLINSPKQKIDDAAALRTELRTENLELKKEVATLEAEVEKWRNQLYELKEQYTLLKVELEYALRRIKEEAERAEKTLP